MTTTRAVDYAHTPKAETRRRLKASRLAGAAAALGMQPYELAIVGAGPHQAENRRRVRRTARLDRDPSVETWHQALAMLEARARQLQSVVECPGCGWPVVRALLYVDEHRPVLLDPWPRRDGTVYQVGPMMVATLLPGDPVPADGHLFRLHSRSCPSQQQDPAERGEVRPP